MFRDILPFSNEHPGSNEIYLLLLTDVSADPGEGLRLTVLIHLIRHFSNTFSDVIVSPEWSHKVMAIEVGSRKEVRRVIRKWPLK